MQSRQNQNSDEIDLRDIFDSIGKTINSFFGGIINFIALIRRVTIKNIKSFSIVTVVFLVFSLGYYFKLSKNVYGSSMVLKSAYLNMQLLDNTFDKFDLLAKEEEKITLAHILKIDVATANLINGLKVEPFVTEDERLEVELLKEKLLNLNLEEDVIISISQKIELRNPHTFKITVYTETNSVISILDSAIINYFLNNNYIKNRIDINRITLKKRKSKLEKEQIKIDSLKKTIIDVYQSLSKNSSSQGSDNVILAGQEITNPLHVFREDININDEILNIEKVLFLKSEVELIEGFTPFNKPVSISLPWLIVFTLLSAIGVTYLMLIMISLNKFLAERDKQLDL